MDGHWDVLLNLDDRELCSTSIRPAAQRMRSCPLSSRGALYASLRPGQRALFMFLVVYAHGAMGWSQLICELPHLVGEPEFWAEIGSAFRYLGLRDLSEALAEFEERERPDSSAGMGDLDRKLATQLERSVSIVANRIRSAPQEFLESP